MSRCLFLLSHSNIWPNPWWIFGTLAIFVEVCLFLLNLPFSYYNRHLWRFPSLSLQLGFYQTFNGSCPILPFLKFAIFAKIANCQYASFVVPFKFFARPLHVMNPLPNSPISQECHFRKTHNYRHASFVILPTFLPNLSFL